jgi:hypothetical protein
MQVLELEGLGLLNVAHGLHWVLLFIPFYSVAKGLYGLGYNIFFAKRLLGKNFILRLSLQE